MTTMAAGRAMDAAQYTRRTEIVAKARENLHAAGTSWAEAKQWACLTGRWKPASLKAINAEVVEAYLAEVVHARAIDDALGLVTE